MLKLIVATIATLGMASAQADSIARASNGSVDSLSTAKDGVVHGTVHSWNGSIATVSAAGQLNTKGVSGGLGDVVTGSAEVVVASVHFVGDSALVSFNFVKDSASFTVEVSKEVGGQLHRGAKATLAFVANTVGDASVTFSGQVIFALGDLSQGNLKGSVQNILLLPSEVWNALMTPDEFYADKYTKGRN